MKKLVVTVNKSVQIGFDEWRDSPISKVFPYTATIQEIEDWIASTKTVKGLLSAKISELVAEETPSQK